MLYIAIFETFGQWFLASQTWVWTFADNIKDWFWGMIPWFLSLGNTWQQVVLAGYLAFVVYLGWTGQFNDMSKNRVVRIFQRIGYAIVGPPLVFAVMSLTIPTMLLLFFYSGWAVTWVMVGAFDLMVFLGEIPLRWVGFWFG
ncbi:MAG: hypothetical protein Q8P44_10155 [Dehalococcoidia bacterium]|nr:hypothetical protein [Dehalococcoidia bacterium]